MNITRFSLGLRSWGLKHHQTQPTARYEQQTTTMTAIKAFQISNTGLVPGASPKPVTNGKCGTKRKNAFFTRLCSIDVLALRRFANGLSTPTSLTCKCIWSILIKSHRERCSSLWSNQLSCFSLVHYWYDLCTGCDVWLVKEGKTAFQIRYLVIQLQARVHNMIYQIEFLLLCNVQWCDNEFKRLPPHQYRTFWSGQHRPRPLSSTHHIRSLLL
jgi:hypothetical protein